MTEQEVVTLMQSSKNETEWNANCDHVQRTCNGYPQFWFEAILLSGVMARTQKQWC